MKKIEGITAEMVKRIFGGGYIVRLDLQCKRCKDSGRIVKRKWPDGRQGWGCHLCGREIESMERARL